MVLPGIRVRGAPEATEHVAHGEDLRDEFGHFVHLLVELLPLLFLLAARQTSANARVLNA